MELIDISVQDGKGLIKIAICRIQDRVRIQDFFREAEKLFIDREEIENLRSMYDAQCSCTDEWAEKYRAEVEHKADATLTDRINELEQALAAVNARLANAQVVGA